MLLSNAPSSLSRHAAMGTTSPSCLLRFRTRLHHISVATANTPPWKLLSPAGSYEKMTQTLTLTRPMSTNTSGNSKTHPFNPSSSFPPPPSQSNLSPAGLAFFGSLCVGTLGLGIWQTQRYFEKVELVTHREKQLKLEPMELSLQAHASNSEITSMNQRNEKYESQEKNNLQEGGNGVSNMEHRRMITAGRFDYTHEVLVGPRAPPPGCHVTLSRRQGGGLSSNPQGYHVITPLHRKEQDGNTVMVNRGWIPRSYALAAEKNEGDIRWERPKGNVVVEGVVGKTESARRFVPDSTVTAKTRNDGGLPKAKDYGPTKLLWMDRKALEKYTGTALTDDSSSISSIQEEENEESFDHHPMLLIETTSGASHAYPAQPQAQYVNEFPILPPTHFAYAVTWYGLSLAGCLMTRRLVRGGGFQTARGWW